MSAFIKDGGFKEWVPILYSGKESGKVFIEATFRPDVAEVSSAPIPSQDEAGATVLLPEEVKVEETAAQVLASEEKDKEGQRGDGQAQADDLQAHKTLATEGDLTERALVIEGGSQESAAAQSQEAQTATSVVVIPEEVKSEAAAPLDT